MRSKTCGSAGLVLRADSFSASVFGAPAGPGSGRGTVHCCLLHEYEFGCSIQSRASHFFPSGSQSQEGGLLTHMDVVRCIPRSACAQQRDAAVLSMFSGRPPPDGAPHRCRSWALFLH